MTLSEVSTLLPPPEGMEWIERPSSEDDHFLLSTGACRVRRKVPGTTWRVTATLGNAEVVITCERVNLVSTYLRALAAVGLAPDPEVEALRAEVAELRRRLTWTSEVPTEPGVYVVGRGVKPYDGSIMFRRWDEDGGKMERPWVDAFGLPWTDEQMKGRRFFALDNLKETP